MSNSYRIAIYLRLSRDDGNEESQSIQSQREMLTEYVQRQGWKIFDEYSDDGYSGTDFNRPEFQRMLNDIENGKINMVITKDLSRLGRNYIQVGYYTEEYFPLKGVRYIAVNDSYDSLDEDSNDFVPLRNFMNEWYAKDTSKKIRSILNQKAKNGEPRNTSVPIYGYTYNEKHERVPDSETSLVVQAIYKKFIETGSIRKVAEFLKENKYPTPAYHNAVKYKFARQKILALPEESFYTWNVSTIREIIKKDEYLGVYRTAQTKSISFKNKRRFENKDCYVFENRYEPLVDKDTWYLAQSLLKTSKGSSIGVDDNVFKGLVYCMDCEKNMRVRREKNHSGEYVYSFTCHHKDCVGSNYILMSLLERIVARELIVLKEIILSQREKFLNFALMYKPDSKKYTLDLNKELSILEAREKEIDNFMENLVVQHTKGLIPQSTLKNLLDKHRKEKVVIDKEIERVKRRINDEDNKPTDKQNIEELINILESTTEENILRAGVVQKLISKIYVKSSQAQPKSREREINVTIIYSSYDEIIKGFITNE